MNRTTSSGAEETQEWVKGATFPAGVTIDAGHIYWANLGTGSIGRANLAGGEVEPEFRKAAFDLWGVAVGYATADSDATSLPFGSVVTGSFSESKPVTITNHGNQALLIKGLALSGASPSQFLVEAGSCGSVVAPGASCAVQVRFAPQAEGVLRATLTAQTNAESDPVISLTGTGTQAPLGKPDTSVRSGPPGRSTNRRPHFVFGSNQKGSTFICRLDKQKFHPCKAKVTFKVKPGHHVLRVKAVGPAGLVDPTAAKRSFVVVAKQRR